ncbi:MAG: hypothetical protein M1837_005635 [Sclerophora amabilis]|nr:MAG: hypothetical protein M1837_005635 [Sclerophora amabilis]
MKFIFSVAYVALLALSSLAEDPESCATIQVDGKPLPPKQLENINKWYCGNGIPGSFRYGGAQCYDKILEEPDELSASQIIVGMLDPRMIGSPA